MTNNYVNDDDYFCPNCGCPATDREICQDCGRMRMYVSMRGLSHDLKISSIHIIKIKNGKKRGINPSFLIDVFDFLRYTIKQYIKGVGYVKITVTNFDLEKTLECGQCFHFTKLNANEYIVYGLDSVCRVSQKGKEVIIYCSDKDINYWSDYFTLNIDYTMILEYLLSFAIINKDKFALNSLEKGKGIRILRQPLFETCCSYILSQQNRIPRIQQMVFMLSENFSTITGKLDGKTYSCFPSIEDLKKVSQKSFEDLKLGYRSSYIYEFCKNWDKLKESFTYEYEKDKSLLKTQKGIGEKVANCICLYGLNELDAFPIDTWMNKIIQEEYINKGQKLVLPQKYAGILQQYMFYTKRMS